MKTTTDRQRGVMLTLLELDDVVESATTFYKTRHPDREGVTVTMRLGFEPYAVADTDHGMFVVNNEGVGYEVTDSDPLELDLYASFDEGGQQSFEVLPSVMSSLSPDDVREHATGEQVDLADLVRVFGARLETNFHVWHRELSGGAK